MDDIVTVLAEEHGCLDVIKVCGTLLASVFLANAVLYFTKNQPFMALLSQKDL